MKRMLKENSLKKKSILVTGGGSGLGRSMVEYFYDLGADIIITSRRENLLTKVAKDRATVPSKRGIRYFGPSQMNLFSLLIHSFSIIAVFRPNCAVLIAA
mgnify:CR=1 FL=1